LKNQNVQLEQRIMGEFNRLVFLLHKSNISLNTVMKDDVLWLIFNSKVDNFDEKTWIETIKIPLPKANDNLILMHDHNVTRVMCNYWIESEQSIVDYHEIIYRTICCSEVAMHKSFIARLVQQLDFTIITINYMQKAINNVVATMPLYETDMNAYVMNRRLIIVDPEFDNLNDPNERLQYQIEKNKKYYAAYGWTSIGLSDGVLADKNYILTEDVKKYIPFSKYHNPQRNLYSTFSMKGDYLPIVRSVSLNALIESGIDRRGWNLTTAIVDVEENFEDQILVDTRHKGNFTTSKRKYTIYSNSVLVKEGDVVNTGDQLAIENGALVVFFTKCDSGVIKKIEHKNNHIIGQDIYEISIITIEIIRYLKDGSKFTNMHGNKGVIRFKDLGIAHQKGREVPIDVMISAASINRRRNFGQILEALTNLLHPDEDAVVVQDNYEIDISEIKEALKNKGFPENGMFEIDTYCGKYKGIVGKIFWGVSKDPEDQLWSGKKTTVTNNKGDRVSGLKFSHVEFKALITQFGPNNAVVKEILSYAQGKESLEEYIKILDSAVGVIDSTIPVINYKQVKCVDVEKGVFHAPEDISGTIVDATYMPDGFVIELPAAYQITVSKKNADLYTVGVPGTEVPDDHESITTNKVYIPKTIVKKCWKHQSNKRGLSKMGLMLNNIVHNAHETVDFKTLMTLYRSITSYYKNVSIMVGSKTGDLSTYGMSVRYPHSSRAIATLSKDLPKNTIEIHENMGRDLGVKNGDSLLVERYPCLGFMSIRPQYVKLTDDPMCRYTIRVSNNDLVSENLDFDGDTLFLASFKTFESNELLRNGLENPNKICNDIINKMNNKKIPCDDKVGLGLDEFNITKFKTLTCEEHALLVSRATGVKSHTGPIIALAYNLMRIVERNVPFENTEVHASIEVLLDLLGNSVFSQKHGIKSLQKEATDAICTANIEKMVSLGFERTPSTLLCNIIGREAKAMNIHDLVKFHKTSRSNIINTLVRRNNKLYFASRALLGPFKLREHLRAPALDLPSFMFNHIMHQKDKNQNV